MIVSFRSNSLSSVGMDSLLIPEVQFSGSLTYLLLLVKSTSEKGLGDQKELESV